MPTATCARPPAHAVERTHCTRTGSHGPRAPPSRREALQRARTIEADEIMVEHLGKVDAGAARERMIARDHENEAVGAIRIGLQPTGIDGARTIPMSATPSRSARRSRPTVSLQIDADMRVIGENKAEGFRAGIRERVGIGENSHLPASPPA